MVVINNSRALDAVKASEARAVQQSALNASLAKRGALNETASGYQPLNSDLTTLAGLTASDGDFIQRVSGAWINRSAAQTKTDLGLDNIDNTADADKPVSTAQATAINAKLEWTSVPASASATGTAGQTAYEAGFLYVCVATDTWQRVAIATW